MKNYKYLLLLGLIFIAACTSQINTDVKVSETDDPKGTENDDQPLITIDDTVPADTADVEAPDINTADLPGWLTAELKDVRTGDTFTIAQFDKPVLLESFAVWCPTCKKQQNKLKDLHEEIGDDVVSIGLDTDPNEDETKVLDYANDNGFNWRYAVSPTAMTQGLIDEFGVNVVNAPQAPVILICEDNSFELLKRGVKDTEDLKTAINRCA